MQHALAVFATAWAWHKHAVHMMSAPDFQPIVSRKDSDGTTRSLPNPWFKILNEQARVMATFASKLFLTPADRQSLLGAGKEKPSKFDGLLAPMKPILATRQ